MKQSRALALAVAAIIGWAAASPARAESSASEGARKLYSESGLDKRVGMIDERIMQRVRAAPSAPSAEALERISGAVTSIYGSDALGKQILAQLESQYDPALAEKAFAWLDSDEGEEVRKLEEKGSSVDFETIQKFAESLAENPPPDERATLIRRLDVAVGATSNGVEVALGTGLGVEIALNSVSDSPVPVEKIRAHADSQRPKLFQMFQAINLAGLLYTYQSLSDSQLVEYLRFAESDAGKWYSGTTGEAFGKAVMDASVRLEKELSHGTSKSGQ